MCCLFSIAASTQGINVKGDELDALGGMLSSAQWSFPDFQEYKNELIQPAFVGEEPVMVTTTVKVDVNQPAADEQWKKLQKMVA